MFAAMAKNLGGSAVNLGISSAALLVMEPACIPEAGYHQPVPDTAHCLTISRQPGDGSNRGGVKQESVGVTKFASGKQLRQKGRDGQPRDVVIRQRGMTGIS